MKKEKVTLNMALADFHRYLKERALRQGHIILVSDAGGMIWHGEEKDIPAHFLDRSINKATCFYGSVDDPDYEKGPLGTVDYNIELELEKISIWERLRFWKRNHLNRQV